MSELAEQLRGSIERAAERYREGVRREETNVKPEAHPLPTMEEAWQAWCEAAYDRDATPDRGEFERWWRPDVGSRTDNQPKGALMRETTEDRPGEGDQQQQGDGGQEGGQQGGDEGQQGGGDGGQQDEGGDGGSQE